jgi:hypothetical protein
VGGVHCDEAGRRPVTAMITIGVDPQELHLTRVTGDVDATFARTYREGDLLAFSDGTVLRARWQPTFYGLLRLTGTAQLLVDTDGEWVSGRGCGLVDGLVLDRGESSEGSLASAAVVGLLDPDHDREA